MSDAQHTKRACLYARFSPRRDAEKSESIELQLDRCRKWCEITEYQIVGELEDRELSGGKADNRPGLQDALALACREKATLVCYSLSRLARNTRDALEIVDRLQKSGANLALLDLQMDTSTPIGRCVFTILSAVAELERRQIGQRTSDSMRRKQANGKLVSKIPPYGWRLNEDSIVEDHSEQIVVATIRRLAETSTPSAIASKLNELKIPCRNNGWHHSTIERILRRAKEAAQ